MNTNNIVKLLFLTALIFQSANAKWFWEDKTEEVQTNTFKVVKSSADREGKLISYSITDISKRVLTKKTISKDKSFVGEFKAYFDNYLKGMEAEAQIYTKVNLGIDLSKLKSGDIIVKDKKIIVNLPAIEIISAEIDFANSVIMTKESGILNSNKVRDDFLQELFMIHKAEIKRNVLSRENTIDQARDSASETIKNILLQKFDKSYKIEIKAK